MGLNFENRAPIPPQSISIELYPTLVGGKLHVEPGETIGVDAIDPVPPGERFEQIARANVMRAKSTPLAHPVWDHRLIPNPESRLRRVTQENVLRGILEEVPVPGGVADWKSAS